MKSSNYIKILLKTLIYLELQQTFEIKLQITSTLN